MIDQSFHSKPEALAKGEYGLSGMAGISTEANTAYKELVVIEAQMRDMAKAIVGAGPISEGEQKIIKDALGGVSTPGDADSRKTTPLITTFLWFSMMYLYLPILVFLY